MQHRDTRRSQRATTAASLLALLLSAAWLVGCGGSTQSANTNVSAAREAVVVDLSPLRVTLPNGAVIALEPSGAITLDGELFGTLHADGRIARPDGTTRSALMIDGQISYRGEISPLRVERDRLLAGDMARGSLAIAAPDRLQDLRADGSVAAEVPVMGLRPSNQATLLYVIAVVALDRLEAEAGGRQAEAAVVAAEPVLRVPVEGAPQRGPDDALVTVVVFSDLECPFCSRVVPTLERVLEHYGNDVRVVFRHTPLPFHARAMPAAEATMEAYAQRGAPGFWQMHDLIFENQRDLDDASLERYAQLVGLDLTRFRAAMASHTHEAAIRADMAIGQRVGVSGTPSFFINGRALVGAQPFEAFQQAIDSERSAAQRRVAGGTPRAQLYERILAEGLAEAPREPTPSGGYDADEDAQRRWVIADRAGAPTRGPARAPVTIQVFSDFQCPFCGRVVPTLERIVSTYGARVRIVFRHYPLPFHAWAREAAELAVEVHRQRGDAAFWQFHDLVFENQRQISGAETARAGLLALAQQIRGIDIRRAERALEQHTHAAAVETDMDAVTAAGAAIGTPTFFINGRRIAGAQPYDVFQTLIDEELAAPPQ